MSWLLILQTLRLEHIAQNLYNLVGRRPPRLSRSINFLERVDNVLTVKRDVRLVQRSTVARVESCVPLLVLVAETDDNHIRLLNQSTSTD